MKFTMSLCVSTVCNLHCRYCIAEIPRNQDLDCQFDFEAAFEWLEENEKGCNVHLGGGEPLMVEGVSDFALRLLDNGYNVTIFTNTTLLQSVSELWDKPIMWQCSHHYESGISYEQFFENVSVLQAENVLAVRVLWGRDAQQNKMQCEQRYRDAGLEFMWLDYKAGYHDYELQNNFGKKPNKHFRMMGPWGDIHNCSNPKFGKVGHASDKSLDRGNEDMFECKRPNNWPHGCQACQSADIFGEKHKKRKGQK